MNLYLYYLKYTLLAVLLFFHFGIFGPAMMSAKGTFTNMMWVSITLLFVAPAVAYAVLPDLKKLFGDRH